MKLKKLISMLLCVCMLVSLMPTFAFADEENPAIPETPPCEHDYVATQVVEPTCTAQGYTVYVCSLCGDTYNADYTPTADHTPEEAAAIPATCVKEGRTAGHVCSVCGAILDGCEPVGKADHTPVAAEAIAPSCTAEGRTAGSVCEVCGEVIDGCEPVAKTEHVPVEAAEVPPTCTEPGRKAGTVCKVCGEILDGCEPIEAIGHTPVEVAEVPPEIGKPGTTAGRICETCHEILDGCEPIDALEEETEITIEKQPEDAEPVESEVIFSVVASVNTETEITYQWQKLDESVSYADDAEREAAWKDIEGETSAKLHLTGLDDEDALAEAMKYAYRCVITAGEVTEKTREAHVLEPLNAAKGGTRDAATSGTTSDGLIWTRDEQDTVTITGYDPELLPADLTIPAEIEGFPVKIIGEKAFSACGTLRSVVISEGIEVIGYSAFGDYQSGGTGSISSVSLPDSLVSIGDGAFTGCFNLAGTINISASVQSIGEEAFRLTNITAFSVSPENPNYTGDAYGALYSRDMTVLKCLPTGVTRYTVPEGVQVLEIGALENSYETLTALTLPETLTTIGAHAIWCCNCLTSLHIPASVTSIGTQAFSLCSSLTNLSVAADNPNYRCDDGKTLLSKDGTKLYQVVASVNGTYTVPAGVTSLESCSFEGCSNLTKLVIGANVRNISGISNGVCDKLTVICFEHAAEDSLYISSGAFSYWSWNSSTLSTTVCVADPENINPAIADYDWQGSNRTVTFISLEEEPTPGEEEPVLQDGKYNGMIFEPTSDGAGLQITGWTNDLPADVVIPAEIGGLPVLELGREAFAFNENLRSVVLPETIRSIDWWALNSTSISTINIPANTTYIDDSAFYSCPSLLSINVDPENPVYCSVDGVVYSKDMKTLEQYPDAKPGPFTVPEGVTAIGGYAFRASKGLTGIVLPSSLEAIGKWAFEEAKLVDTVFIPAKVSTIGNRAFCAIDAPITVDGNNPYFSAEDGVLFNKDKTVIIEATRSISGEYVIPDGVRKISYEAFTFCLFTAVDIPATVTEIERWGFWSAHNLQTIRFRHQADDPLTIGESAFVLWGSGPSTTTLIVPDESNINPAIKYYDWAGDGRAVTLPLTERNIVQDGIVYAPAAADNEILVAGYTEELPAAVVIPEAVNGFAVTAIGVGAFRECDLTSVEIPATVRSIGNMAFDRCEGLKEVRIPSGVTDIGYYAFRGCYDLLSITVDPDNPNYSSDSYGVLFNKDKTVLLQYPGGRSGEYPVPDGVIRIEEQAFSDWNAGLTSIVLPASLETVGSYAFYGATYLREVYYGGTEESWKQIEINYGNDPLLNATRYYHIHSWGEPVYTWAEDESAVTASRSCLEDPSHVQQETVRPSLEVTVAPTRESEGRGILTAVFTNPAFETQTKETVLPPIPPSYYVEFDGNGAIYGNMPRQSIAIGVRTPLDANKFNRPGYSFTGWNTKADGKGTKYGNGAAVYNLASEEDAVVTLYAQWTQNNYTVTFNGNGATSGTMKAQAMTYDKAAALTANAFKLTNCTFIGWSTDPRATDPTYADNEKVSNLTALPGGTVTLYAVWAKNSYRIVLNANGGTGDMSEESGWCEYDRTYTLPINTFERPGFEFQGWATSAKGKVVYEDGQDIKGLSNVNGKVINLFAVWTAHKYSIEFNGNGATSGSMKPMSNKSCGSSVTLTANAFTKTGYTFLGWNEDPDATEIRYKNKAKQTNFCTEDGDVLILYAVWGAVEYTITYKNLVSADMIGGSGTNPAGYTVAEDKTINSVTRPGFIFDGWYTTSSFKPGTEVDSTADLGTGNKVLYAKWIIDEEAVQTYTITLAANDGSAAAKQMTKLVFGKTYTLAANSFTRAGYSFLGWSEDPSDTAIQYKNKAGGVCFSGDTTLYAIWSAVEYTITYKNLVSADVIGGSGTNPAGYTVAEDKTINSVTRPGFIFDGWYTTSSFKPGTEVDSTADLGTGNKVLYAKWIIDEEAVQTYTITYNANDGSGRIKETKGLVFGKTYTLVANSFTRAGYSFLGWSEDPSGTAIQYKNKAGGVCFGRDTILYAVWQPIRYKITYKNVTPALFENEGNPADYSVEERVLLKDPVRPGYIFIGWFTDAKYKNGIETIETGSTGAKTLYARWDPDYKVTYTIAFNGNGATSGTTKPMTKRVNGTVYTLTGNSFKRTGYAFAGWNTKADGSGTSYGNKEKVGNLTKTDGATVTLYAQWIPVEYTINYKNVAGARVPGKDRYTIEETYILPVPETEGYTFLGWYTTSTFRNGTRIWQIGPGATGNKTLYAKWQLNDAALRDVRVFFYTNDLTGLDFTMILSHGEDGDVTLRAQAYPTTLTELRFTWSADKEGIIELTPNADGSECLIHQIGVDETGVVLTVECGGITASVTCHCFAENNAQP